MGILIGVSPDESGSDAVALGALLAQLTGLPLVLAHVHPPTPMVPGMHRVDAEWRAFLGERSDAALRSAMEQLASDSPGVEVSTRTIPSSSVSRGLRRVAREVDATITVLGSCHGTDRGHVGIGSIASSLLHGGETAVGIAPAGFQQLAPERIGRLVIGFRDTEESRAAVATAQRIAARTQIPVHLLTAVLRTSRMTSSVLRGDLERAVLDALAQQERLAHDRLRVEHDQGMLGDVIQADSAEDARQAFAWRPDDLFITASSRFGPLRRVLLGDTAYKLLRGSPVPVMVLPRAVEHDDLSEDDWSPT